LAVETYKANHRGVKVWQTDIRSLTAAKVKHRLRLRKGNLDLLAGCPPCQGFSTMTTLNGKRRVDDPRNDLVLEFVRFVRELMPKTVMMENVPGLAQDDRIETMRRTLEGLGYTCEYRVLDAADYGVPQRRRRLIFLAGRAGPVAFARREKCRRTVRQALKHLTHRIALADPLHKIGEKRSRKVRRLIQRIPKDGGSRTDLGKRSQLACHKECDGFKDVYGRMAWDEVAPTITSGCVNPSKGRFLHPEENRCITLREAALLQTFPPDYLFSLRRGKFPAAEMIGNALPPAFVKAHASRLRWHIQSNGQLKGKQPSNGS
jgi:DNA (cytosine-5)-methyltransferase 1